MGVEESSCFPFSNPKIPIPGCKYLKFPKLIAGESDEFDNLSDIVEIVDLVTKVSDFIALRLIAKWTNLELYGKIKISYLFLYCEWLATSSRCTRLLPEDG